MGSLPVDMSELEQFLENLSPPKVLGSGLAVSTLLYRREGSSFSDCVGNSNDGQVGHSRTHGVQMVTRKALEALPDDRCDARSSPDRVKNWGVVKNYGKENIESIDVVESDTEGQPHPGPRRPHRPHNQVEAARVATKVTKNATIRVPNGPSSLCLSKAEKAKRGKTIRETAMIEEELRSLSASNAASTGPWRKDTSGKFTNKTFLSKLQHGKLSIWKKLVNSYQGQLELYLARWLLSLGTVSPPAHAVAPMSVMEILAQDGGISLCKTLEKLSGKLVQYTPHPKTRQEEQRNVSVVLDTLAQRTDVKLAHLCTCEEYFQYPPESVIGVCYELFRTFRLHPAKKVIGPTVDWMNQFSARGLRERVANIPKDLADGTVLQKLVETIYSSTEELEPRSNGSDVGPNAEIVDVLDMSLRKLERSGVPIFVEAEDFRRGVLIRDFVLVQITDIKMHAKLKSDSTREILLKGAQKQIRKTKGERNVKRLTTFNQLYGQQGRPKSTESHALVGSVSQKGSATRKQARSGDVQKSDVQSRQSDCHACSLESTQDKGLSARQQSNDAKKHEALSESGMSRSRVRFSETNDERTFEVNDPPAQSVRITNQVEEPLVEDTEYQAGADIPSDGRVEEDLELSVLDEEFAVVGPPSSEHLQCVTQSPNMQIDHLDDDFADQVVNEILGDVPGNVSIRTRSNQIENGIGVENELALCNELISPASIGDIEKEVKDEEMVMVADYSSVAIFHEVEDYSHPQTLESGIPEEIKTWMERPVTFDGFRRVLKIHCQDRGSGEARKTLLFTVEESPRSKCQAIVRAMTKKDVLRILYALSHPTRKVELLKVEAKDERTKLPIPIPVFALKLTLDDSEHPPVAVTWSQTQMIYVQEIRRDFQQVSRYFLNQFDCHSFLPKTERVWRTLHDFVLQRAVGEDPLQYLEDCKVNSQIGNCS